MYSELPWPVKALIVTAAVLAALSSIWVQVRDSRVLRAVARELLLREGEDGKTLEKAVSAPARANHETVKDVVVKAAAAAKDSREAAATAVTMAVDENAKIREELAALKLQFSRLVVHEARNDLGSSRLADEAEAYLQRVDEEKREKAQEGKNGGV